MFAQRTQCLIEDQTRTIEQINPFVLKAKAGNVTQAECGNYLNNLMYLFQFTCSYLKNAQTKAINRGNSDLADFFAEKITEEKGHDLWARDDLNRMGFNQQTVDLSQINSATFDLFSHILSLIQDDPIALLGHMFFVEYFTVIAAPAFINDLEKCGFNKNHFTSLTNHIELDQFHVQDDLKALEKFVKTPQQEQIVLDAIIGSSQLVHRFLAAIVQ
jgi:hypothetical protein